MDKDEQEILAEGDYALYIHDAEERLGKASPYLRIGLSESKIGKPICHLYIGSGPQAKLVWGRRLREYGKKAGLPRSCYADDMKIVDFIHSLRLRKMLLNVLVKHRQFGENQVGLDVQLRLPTED